MRKIRVFNSPQSEVIGAWKFSPVRREIGQFLSTLVVFGFVFLVALLMLNFVPSIWSQATGPLHSDGIVQLISCLVFAVASSIAFWHILRLALYNSIPIQRASHYLSRVTILWFVLSALSALMGWFGISSSSIPPLYEALWGWRLSFCISLALVVTYAARVPFRFENKSLHATVNLTVSFSGDEQASIQYLTTPNKMVVREDSSQEQPHPVTKPHSLANLLPWLLHCEAVSGNPLRVREITKNGAKVTHCVIGCDKNFRFEFRPALLIAFFVLGGIPFVPIWSVHHDPSSVFGELKLHLLFVAIASTVLWWIVLARQKKHLFVELDFVRHQMHLRWCTFGPVIKKFQIYFGASTDLEFLCLRLEELQATTEASIDLSYSSFNDKDHF